MSHSAKYERALLNVNNPLGLHWAVKILKSFFALVLCPGAALGGENSVVLWCEGAGGVSSCQPGLLSAQIQNSSAEMLNSGVACAWGLPVCGLSE